MNRYFKSNLMILVLTGIYGNGYAQTAVYQYEYDITGNVTKITNALNAVTQQNFDALGRLQSQVDANNQTTSYQYDGQGRLVKVTDARGLNTLYGVDGLGNQLSLTSPDTGAITTTVDIAGNILTRTDAKNQTTSYAYDVLNRITRITYNDGSITNYSYDQGVNAKGRLTQISDASGTIQYIYDSRGRVLTETRTMSGTGYVTGYQYDIAGRVSSMTYPNGRKVSYSRDGLGRISQIDTTKDGIAMTILSQAVYHPFGGIQSYRNSAGQTYSRTFDGDERIASYTLNNKVQAITYDAANRITSINEVNNSSRQISHGFDSLNRLTSYQTPQTSQTFTYDAVGNRTAKTTGAANTSYSYDPASNRLTQVTDSQSKAVSTDANGSITSNGNAQFSYDVRGRMASVTTSIGVVQYTINALGQRVQKAVPANGSNAATSTLYHYDGGGKLISEHTGQSDVDYIYLDNIPVAVIK